MFTIWSDAWRNLTRRRWRRLPRWCFWINRRRRRRKSLGLSRRQVERRYGAALDRLSYRLLTAEMLQPLPITLEQPDCLVCLRNAELSAPAGVGETEAIRCGEQARRLPLPPKKPAASVRTAVPDMRQRAVARGVVRMGTLAAGADSLGQCVKQMSNYLAVMLSGTLVETPL